MANRRVLLVDDDEMIRHNLGNILETRGYEITLAASVPEALQSITTQPYDVLLSDLHMPGPGDGLTVVSAMRHANPHAVTLLLSAFPDMEKAAEAILHQTDEILIKPISASTVVDVITQRLSGAPAPAPIFESAATILDREITTTILQWYKAVEESESLMTVAISYKQRCAYLWIILNDLVARLRSDEPLGSSRPVSLVSQEHGATRYRQGYTPAMIVEESRFLQVSIFQTLQTNLAHVDFSSVLTDVMAIADEIDYQLSQMMVGYAAASAG